MGRRTSGKTNDYRDIVRQLVGPDGEPGNGWALGSGVPLCEWDGIVCGGGTYGDDLLEINLENKNLNGGYIHKDIGYITSLKKLRLNNTSIVGTIPNSIGQLPFIEEFTVSSNNLMGTIPTFISSTLHTLNISHNQFVGTLSSEFYFGHIGHDKLITFDVESNKLSGTISEAIGMWHNVETISLSDNMFTGTIPKAFGILTSNKLSYLYLNNNQFVGTIPSDLIGMSGGTTSTSSSSSSSSSSSLIELWLHENMLSGTIPADFADILAVTGGTLTDFYIDGNKLTGDIPPELCGTNTQPAVNADFFKDIYGDKTGDVTSKRPEHPCDILSCPINTYSLEGMFPCQPCPNNEIMPWLGGEEHCLKKQTLDILKQFYIDTNGQTWTLPQHRNNWFAHNLKDNYCAFEGIECNDDGHLIELLLPNAGLSGTITPDIGMLEHLQTLDLSNNLLKGGLPSELRFASSLTILDISGNQLNGPVPPLLCKVPGINGNGQGGPLGDEYKCSYIACPPGTASIIGRESLDGTIQCNKCNNNHNHPHNVNILGLKDCSTYIQPQWMIDLQTMEGNINALEQSQSSSNDSTLQIIKAVGITMLIISLFITFCTLCISCYKRYKTRQRKKILNSISNHQPTLDEMFQHLSSSSPNSNTNQNMNTTYTATTSSPMNKNNFSSNSSSVWHVGGDSGTKKHSRQQHSSNNNNNNNNHVHGSSTPRRATTTTNSSNNDDQNSTTSDNDNDDEQEQMMQSLEMITQMQRRNKTSNSFVFHQAAAADKHPYDDEIDHDDDDHDDNVGSEQNGEKTTTTTSNSTTEDEATTTTTTASTSTMIPADEEKGSSIIVESDSKEIV